MYHDLKIPGCLTALVSFLLITSSITAQNSGPLISNQYLGKKTIKKITIEETWNGSQWMNFEKKIVNYDIKSNCLEEVIQRWNNFRWINDTRTLTYYDRLQLQNAKIIYNWKNNGNWEIVEGERIYVDTVLNNGCRLVLHDCNWEPKKKIWIAEDSIFYDANGRVIRQVSIDYDKSETLKNATKVITSEYIYQKEDMWIEIQTTKQPDKKSAEKEQFRYRKISDFPLHTFTIDYWDERMNRWVQNTAKMYKNTDNKYSVYDSIEESINGQPVPVFVEAEDRDSSGNLMSNRIILRNYDEDRKIWSGTYYKWERVLCKASNEYFIAESSFTLNTTGGSWVLNSYEKKLCRLPLAGGYEESGNYDVNFKSWEYFQSFDTLHTSGVILNKENFFDKKNKQWIPLTNFSCTRTGDSISILKTYFDMDKNSWYNDSLFTIQLDSSGSVLSRTNLVWTQSGLLSEKWDKVSRISFTQE